VVNVRQTEIHTAEPLVNELGAFEVGMVIKKIESQKSQVTAPITAELIKAGGTTICSEIRKFINSVWNKKKMSE
jgi:hypothetical protein